MPCMEALISCILTVIMFTDRTVYFLAVAALLQQASGYAADPCTYKLKLILSGHKIPIEDAPYMAALQRIDPSGLEPEPEIFCGATIIHKRFLLTAAHCRPTRNQAKLPVIASIGSERYRNTSTNTIMDVEKFLCQKQFDGKNDICLVKLRKPVPFGAKIAKIKLADKKFKIKTRTMVTITGWGRIKDAGPLPLDLLRTTVPVLSTECCHKTDRTIDDTMICAGFKGRGACHGDSGGPLLYNNVQIGVASRLANSNNQSGLCGDGMDVYTRVSDYLDWIHTTIADNL